MATHSRTPAWKIPWMEESGGLQSMGSLSRTQLSNFTFTFHFHALEKEMATHSSVLACRIPGTGEPGGLPSMGSCRVGHDWSDLAAAAADGVLKSRDITSPIKVCKVKAMVSPVVICGWESWTIKKAECQRIDAFELWCCRRLLRVPWTGRSNQSILKKSTLNIHWRDWCWSSNTLANWCKELTHWKRPWCWERLKAKGEVDSRGYG